MYTDYKLATLAAAKIRTCFETKLRSKSINSYAPQTRQNCNQIRP